MALITTRCARLQLEVEVDDLVRAAFATSSSAKSKKHGRRLASRFLLRAWQIENSRFTEIVLGDNFRKATEMDARTGAAKGRPKAPNYSLLLLYL